MAADLEFLLHLFGQHPRWIGHHLRRDRVGLVAGHPLCLVDECELVALHLGHQGDLVLLHRDLVGVHLLLAFCREVAGGPHRQCVGNEAGDAGDDDRLVLLCHRRADHAGHEAEVRGETVVEPVDHVAQHAAARRAVPGLAVAAGEAGEFGRVFLRLLGQQQRLAAAHRARRRRPVQVEVTLHLAPLFGQQHGEEEPGAEALAEERQQASAPRGAERAGRAAGLPDHLSPDSDVAVFDIR